MRWAPCVVLLAAGCGDNLPPTDPAAQPCVLATDLGTDPQVEAVSPDGTLVAFSSGGASARTLFVASTSCKATSRTSVTSTSTVVPARFCGGALLVFASANNDDRAGQLLAWRPGDTAPTVLATRVDPGATRCAPGGAYVLTEANDTDYHGTQPVDLVIARTGDLSTRTIASLDHPRARFTPDGQRVVYSGGNTDTAIAWQAVDGTDDAAVATTTVRQRWEVTPDGAALVYAPSAGTLARHPFDGSAETVLSTELGHVVGKEMDVAPDGSVALVAETGGLWIDDTFQDVEIDSIVDHLGPVLVYRRGPIEVATLADGSDSLALGARDVVDHRDDAVAVLGSDGVVVRLHPLRLQQLGPADEVVLAPDGRAIVQHAHGVTPIEIVDEDGTAQTLLAEAHGPFVLAGDWIAAVSGDGTLLRIPLPR